MTRITEEQYLTFKERLQQYKEKLAMQNTPSEQQSEEDVDDETPGEDNMDLYNSAKFSEALEKIGDARNAIMDLYNDFLYEEWTDTDIETFNLQLLIYNKYLDIVKELLPQIKWESEEKRINFIKNYFKVITDDNTSFNLVKIRHESYLIYRTNRKSLISQLNKVVGLVKMKNGKNLVEVFDYINNECAKIPLKTTGVNTLLTWINNHLNELTKLINESPSIESNYTKEEVSSIFRKYVHCRKMVFAIFNMITSSSEVNGYKKWHNILDSYCEADIKDVQLHRLYNAANSESTFLPVDDYQLIMDDKSWNLRGIYESWFDEDLEYYRTTNHNKVSKQQIKKIDMLDSKVNQCKIATDGKYVYSTTIFYPGDIIEICPTKQIDRTSLYSKDMRSIVFEVIPNKKYVIPFGYCQYYDIDNDELKTNCNYIWDPIKLVIVIRATNKIPKYTKLVINNVNKINY